MDKAQAIHNFWNSFGWKAYDETSVPDNAEMPYITYAVRTDSIGYEVNLYASLWDRTTSWQRISKKAEEIAEYIQRQNPISIPIDNGRLYITKDTPFAQRMSDEDDMVRRIYLICNGEFLTSY